MDAIIAEQGEQADGSWGVLNLRTGTTQTEPKSHSRPERSHLPLPNILLPMSLNLLQILAIFIGDPGRIRTSDLQLRRLLLYPLSYGAT